MEERNSEQIKQLRIEMVPKDGSSEEHFKQPVQDYPFSESAGVPRLQAETPTLLLTDEKPERFPPLQVPGPVLSSQQLPVGESVREIYNRIKGHYKWWMRPNSCTKEQIGETIVLEQYLCVLYPDIRTWVKEQNRQTGKEATALAERYTAAH